MIVVCGDVVGADRRVTLASVILGRAAAASAAATVQAIAVVPDDPDGDRRLAALTAAGVGHAAVLRAPRRPLEAADIDLAVRYLAEVRVAIGVDLTPAASETLAQAAGFAGGTAILLFTGAGTTSSDDTQAMPSMISSEAIVLAAPHSDPDGTFAGFVAAFAVRLDVGDTPADAWAATTGALAVDAIRA